MISVLLLSSGILLPPKQYRGIPEMPVKVIEGTQEEVDRFCRKSAKYHGQRSIQACALPGKKLCIIIWPEELPRHGRLWVHEQAHCRGWKHQ